ncbi:MAG TPA: bifunctional fructose-bisphosphatase/inositol-phosphate phosphatase [Methanocorpusculum sp.]|nr:bifunctional fructose-bisphosphatase/inositol-phosphate phosphatase [Methanocorpusculum sp.]HJJ39607.1 bifunctional fructose-bisphosphatase/inositol-phosphate phosphatase [Methanocorpusculum sp.]HJJ49216.1 bifunctional fructose-bisphosphatase/inositol-phosphate phosphatase [Methanocorpusculum sp.]HJJ56740.1 bifunctional fructose-bisphosphatase/inositol-phosphate phosphatase [Methanocorpusculum sp.]HJJ95489.1 bifunctional fructose-bisphosphatase/inositol-phosphate phosphatase [Methanocorpuscu
MISPDDFLNLCGKIALQIEDALASIIGTEFGAEELCMGADNTPTERLDKIAEDIVLDEFRKARACKYILSEEAGMVDVGGDSGIAYLDPVDGSFNAGVGIPFYALSIGLSNGKEMIAGYVRNLALHETFTAIKGKGAFVDGKPICTSKKDSFETCALSVYARPPEMKRMLDLGYSSRRSRKFGASALELCYVACGRIEGFLDLRGTLRITDAAAAILVLQESGGIVTFPDGTPYEFPDDVRCGRCLLGANKPMHTLLSELMRSL